MSRLWPQSQVRGDSVLCQGGGEGGGEERPDLGYILKSEPRGFAYSLGGVGGKKER